MARPEQWPWMRPEMRLGDADRERAIGLLGDHYAAGRLDKDEFDERSDAVWTARTAGDLEPVFADLALPVRERRGPGHPAPWAPRGWFPLPFVPVLFAMVALTATTHVPFVLAFLVAVWVVRRSRSSAMQRQP
jgi:hypothetical protein